MGLTKLFKTYRKVKDIFVRPSLRFYFGKWRNDPNLPVWRKKSIWYFKIFNWDVCSKYKYGDICYEFPPQFTIVFFGLSFTITAHAPKINDNLSLDDHYWEAVLNAAYAPEGVERLEYAFKKMGHWVKYNKNGTETKYHAIRPGYIKPEYMNRYNKLCSDSYCIKIKNRYNELIYLVNIEDNKYRLLSDGFRVICDKDYREIKAIDPSGGPFMTVGFKFPKYHKEIKEFRKETNGEIILIIDDYEDN